MEIIKQLGPAGTHYRVKRLSDRLSGEILKIYREDFPEIEPSWFAILLAVSEKEPCSISQVADSLGISHPAVIQFAGRMEKAGLISFSNDDIDKRKKLLALLPAAKEILDAVKPINADIEKAYTALADETGLDLSYVLETIENSLSAVSLYDRFKAAKKERIIRQVEIVAYNPSYDGLFYSLNSEWLQKYFEVEPEDEKILSNPRKEIIKKGGMIFFARIDGEIVGTCAAIKIDKSTYELAKMAVTEKAKGKQAGKKLALAVIGFAWSKKAKFVTLLTNIRLTAAVNLYKSLGFETVPGRQESSYKRSVIRMTLEL